MSGPRMRWIPMSGMAFQNRVEPAIVSVAMKRFGVLVLLCAAGCGGGGSNSVLMPFAKYAGNYSGTYTVLNHGGGYGAGTITFSVDRSGSLSGTFTDGTNTLQITASMGVNSDNGSAYATGTYLRPPDLADGRIQFAWVPIGDTKDVTGSTFVGDIPEFNLAATRTP